MRDRALWLRIYRTPAAQHITLRVSTATSKRSRLIAKALEMGPEAMPATCEY